MSVMERGDFSSLSIQPTDEALQEVGAKVLAKVNQTYFELETEKPSAELRASMGGETPVDEKDVLRLIEGYASIGFATPSEKEMAERFMKFCESTLSDGSMTAVEFQERTDRFINENKLTYSLAPATYVSLQMLKGMFPVLSTEETSLGVEKGVEDNMLCRFTGSGGNCGTNPIQTVLAYIAGGLTSYLLTDISNTESDVVKAAFSVVGSLISLAVSSLGNNCDLECDDCAAALGIAHDDCNPVDGLEAIGAFEHNEGFNWFIDGDKNGTYETGPILTTANWLPASDFPSSTVSFYARVNVICDGFNVQAWPQQNGILVDPVTGVTPQYPSASVTGPPLNNGYFYRPNTNLCFNLNVVSSGDYEFTGWQTTSLGNPSSGSATAQFCTTFSDPGYATTASVNAVFMEPCTGATTYASRSFVLCGSCN